MRVSKTIGSVTITADADNSKDVFEQLAKLQEAFAEPKCGKCGCEDLKFVIRKAKSVEDNEEYEYPELVCTNFKCRAKLCYGIGAGGVVYPKRMVTGKKGKAVRDADGKAQYLPDNGWLKYNPETGENE